MALAADPIAWKLSEPAIAARPGAVIRMRITAEIGEGWHVYSMKEIAGGPKPTRFTIDAPAELAGKVEASDPLVAEDTNFNAEVEYYEQSADFVVPVRLPAKLPQRVIVRVRYQSCSAKECLPPKTVELSAAVRAE